MKYASKNDSYNSRLLKKIAYACKLPFDAKVFGESKIPAFNTFPFNPESKTGLKGAQRWAVCGWRDIFKHGDAIPYDVVDNTPIKLRLIDLEVRNRGGRAYKVLDEQNRMFDLREDQLIDTIKLFGIGPGGHLNGVFVWGIQGSQIKLVVVGGTLYRAMVEGAKLTDAVKTNAITASQLKLNHVYQRRNGDNVFFAGKVIMPFEKTVSYAFLEAPSLELPEWEQDESDREKYRNMSWRQKCARSHTFNYGLNVLVIKDPKFVAHLGESDIDCQERINSYDKEKVSFNNHRTCSHILAEAAYEKQYGKRPAISHGYRYTDYWDKYSRREQDIQDWAMKFNALVEWKKE
jgi:hypothetical protein